MQSNSGTSDQPPAAVAAQQRQVTPPPAQAQQHWMAMQYPPPAMVMQHHMMPPPPQHYVTPPPPHYMAATAPAFHPHYPSPHHPYLQPPPSPLHHGGGGGHRYNNSPYRNIGDGSAAAENKTLWVGDLTHWMDEQYLNSCFSSHQVTNIKIIRNKHTCFSEGYGFVEFDSHQTADKVLQTYGSMLMPHTDQPFRLNWASFSTGDKRMDSGSDHSIFVGDLAADVTDSMLHEMFASKYNSVKAAKVVIDANTGRSKGYGFVRFGDDSEKAQALSEMDGVYCSSRPMRLGAATPKKNMGYQQGGYSANGGSAQGSQYEGDSTNTTIFVGGLDKDVMDEDLRQPFSQYGEIVSVKIPVGKNCGFVQFANRTDAEEALQKLNGTVIGKQTVRLSWGRNVANKQMKNGYRNQWNGGGGGAYYGYDGYYTMPHPHDPSMYGYGASPYPYSNK